MHTHNRPLQLARAFAPPRFAAGILVTLALLTAACGDSDPASRIISPPLLSSSSNGPSAAASNFAVLAHTAVSCSGGSITGDVGTFQAPGDAPPGVVTLTEGCQVFGSIHVGDGVAKQAFRNFLAEYERLEALECDFTLTGTLNRTLTTPGVYCFDAGTTTTDGQLTLDGPANGIWIFKIGTLGTGALTGTNFDVVMTNGDPCNVTWWIAQAATMSTSDFQGNILAGAAISMTGGTFNGNAWAGASGVGDVTFTEGTVVTGCEGGKRNGNDKDKCNQGVGNGPEFCDPGNSNQGDPSRSNDELGGTPGSPGRKGGNGK